MNAEKQFLSQSISLNDNQQRYQVKFQKIFVTTEQNRIQGASSFGNLNGKWKKYDE